MEQKNRRKGLPLPYKRAAYLLAALFFAINIFLESVGLTPGWIVRCLNTIRSVELNVSGANK